MVHKGPLLFYWVVFGYIINFVRMTILKVIDIMEWSTIKLLK